MNSSIKKEFDLSFIQNIRIIQSQHIGGGQTMELIEKNGNKQITKLKLRYYQLVKLEEYLTNKLKIKTVLIG